MSLRQKGAIVIFLIFILNFGTLVWYYNFYLSDQVLAEIEEAQQSVNATTFEILSKIQSNQSIDEYGSKSFHNGGCYQIVIENLEGETLYENKSTIKGSLGVHESSIFEYEGSYYLLKVTGVLSVEDPFAISPVMTLLDFEQFNIVISIIILTTLLYLFIIKPIEGLKLDMDQYQKGIKPRKTNRCDEVGKLKNRFVHLANELEDQKLQQSRIIASISHDIKTPLTSIMGYAERLNKGNLSAERMKRYTETIYDKSMVIKELIDEFDHYLNYNLGSSLHKKKMSVKQLEEHLRQDYESELSEIGVEFKVENMCQDEVLEIDHGKIRRVFGNIIDNSIKHMKESTIKRIQIKIQSQAKGVLISIADTGCGVKETELEQIFKPLYTSDQSRKVAGLGLSICQSIIGAHGGRIWATNGRESGLVIHFTLNKS